MNKLIKQTDALGFSASQTFEDSSHAVEMSFSLTYFNKKVDVTIHHSANSGIVIGYQSEIFKDSSTPKITNIYFAKKTVISHSEKTIKCGGFEFRQPIFKHRTKVWLNQDLNIIKENGSFAEKKACMQFMLELTEFVERIYNPATKKSVKQNYKNHFSKKQK